MSVARCPAQGLPYEGEYNTDLACTITFAISVEALDSITNAPAGAGVRIIASDRAFADTVITVDDFGGPYGLAHERAGSYTVTVEQAGHSPWSRSDVQVSRDDCHVRTVALTALLQP